MGPVTLTILVFAAANAVHPNSESFPTLKTVIQHATRKFHPQHHNSEVEERKTQINDLIRMLTNEVSYITDKNKSEKNANVEYFINKGSKTEAGVKRELDASSSNESEEDGEKPGLLDNPDDGTKRALSLSQTESVESKKSEECESSEKPTEEFEIAKYPPLMDETSDSRKHNGSYDSAEDVTESVSDKSLETTVDLPDEETIQVDDEISQTESYPNDKMGGRKDFEDDFFVDLGKYILCKSIKERFGNNLHDLLMNSISLEQKKDPVATLLTHNRQEFLRLCDVDGFQLPTPEPER